MLKHKYSTSDMFNNPATVICDIFDVLQDLICTIYTELCGLTCFCKYLFTWPYL